MNSRFHLPESVARMKPLSRVNLSSRTKIQQMSKVFLFFSDVTEVAEKSMQRLK